VTQGHNLVVCNTVKETPTKKETQENLHPSVLAAYIDMCYEETAVEKSDH
jgi:hypothetical protein